MLYWLIHHMNFFFCSEYSIPLCLCFCLYVRGTSWTIFPKKKVYFSKELSGIGTCKNVMTFQFKMADWQHFKLKFFLKSIDSSILQFTHVGLLQTHLYILCRVFNPFQCKMNILQPSHVSEKGSKFTFPIFLCNPLLTLPVPLLVSTSYFIGILLFD